MSQQQPAPTDFRLQLDEGKRYIEFGGGSKPVVRAGIDVRVDARPCHLPDGSPAVDFVVDLEKPFTEEHGQAISSNEFDGAVSIYALEHVSWRVLPSLLKEIRRVLKDTGSVFFLVPNTQAQMEHLLATQDWDDGGSMLFGGQDYGENAHKAFLSPALITKLLTEAGFRNVVIHPFGLKGTDMAVTAQCDPSIRMNPSAVPEPYPPIRPLSPVQEAREQMITRLTETDTTRAVQEMADAIDKGVKIEPIPPSPKLNEMLKFEEQVKQGIGMGQPMVLKKGTVIGRGILMEDVVQEPPSRPMNSPEFAPYQGEVPPHLKGLWVTCPTEQQVQCAERFRRPYFDGGLPEGGGYQMYLDFPCHELTARYVLEHKPQSVLELGCGRGYVLKRLQDAGILSHGWDISRHCVLTPACSDIVQADATDPGRWAPLPNNTYDLCFSVAFLDHVPEERLDLLFDCMSRVCTRGVHGVNFDQSPGGDSTRLTRKPKEWWQARMPKGHVVVDKAEMEDGELPRRYVEGDGKLKLNVGSNLTMFHNGWVNIDTNDLKGYADHHRYRYFRHDVREGLPYGTGTVDLIFCCHALEHLTYAEGFELLREFRRVIKPGGTVRIIVPDVAELIEEFRVEAEYRNGTNWGNNNFDELSATVAAAPTPMGKLHALAHDNHRSAYDRDTLTEAFNRAGFHPLLSGFRSAPDEGTAQMLKECLDWLPDLSLFMSATPGAF